MTPSSRRSQLERPLLAIVTCLCLLTVSIGTATAASIKYLREIKGPPHTLFTVAKDINNKNQVIGHYLRRLEDGSVIEEVFIYDLALDTYSTFAIQQAAGSLTHATGINERKQIVGHVFNPDNVACPAPHDTCGPEHIVQHGFILDRQRRLTLIDIPGAIATHVFGINGKGDTVGSFQEFDDPAGLSHGFIRSADGVLTVLDIPGVRETIPEAINNSRKIVGAVVHPDGTFQAFSRRSDGNVRLLEIPGAAASVAFDINDRGYIVGDYYTEYPGDPQGFIRTPSGQYIIGLGNEVVAINNFGRMIIYHDHNRIFVAELVE